MSTIVDRIRAEHRQHSRIMGGGVVAAYVCLCDHLYESPADFTEHVAAATEAAVRAQIAADIDGAVSSTHPNRGYRDGIVYAAWIANGGAS